MYQTTWWNANHVSLIHIMNRYFGRFMKRKKQAIVYHGFTTSLGALKCADMLFGGTWVTNKYESATIVSSMIPNLLINMVSWSSFPPVPPYDMNVYNIYMYMEVDLKVHVDRDCWLQRPPVLQHWTPRFFFWVRKSTFLFGESLFWWGVLPYFFYRWRENLLNCEWQGYTRPTYYLQSSGAAPPSTIQVVDFLVDLQRIFSRKFRKSNDKREGAHAP